MMAPNLASRRMHAIALVTVLVAVGLSGCMASSGGMVLKLGSMMPLTGPLSSLGPDMERGAKLAVKHINEANAGIRVDAEYKDDRTVGASEAVNTFNQLLQQGVTAIAGPCCSGITAAVLEKAVEAEVVVSSPSATSPQLVARGPGGQDVNNGFFWRVPPSDAIQGKVLARLVGDNNVTSVSLIVVNNAYGNALGEVFRTHFTTTLSGAVLKTERFDEGATNFESQVASVCSAPMPQGIVLVVYTADGSAILKSMQARGCLGQVKLFASEGVYDPASSFAKGADRDPGGKWLAAGIKGTTPDAGGSHVFTALFNAEYNRDPQLYSAESYDAVMYVALAALKAGSTAGADIAANLQAVANAPGQKVSDFRVAAQLIKEGTDIDWIGQAHDFEFDDRHEPTRGFYSYWEVQSDGSMRIIERGKTA